MNEDVLLYEVTDSVACLTLNRPNAMNSLNLAMLAQLDRRLTEIAVDDEVRVVVLTGKGAAFCAGADLKEVLAGETAAPGEADFLDRIRLQIDSFPKLEHILVPGLNAPEPVGRVMAETVRETGGYGCREKFVFTS